MNVFIHQENDKTGKREAGEEKKKSRPISKRLRGAFLPSFRGPHCEKIVCMKGVPGLDGTLGKTNSHFHPIRRVGTAPPR